VFDQLFVSTTSLQRTVSIYWLVAVLPFISVSTLRTPYATCILISHRVSLVKPNPLRFRALQMVGSAAIYPNLIAAMELSDRIASRELRVRSTVVQDL